MNMAYSVVYASSKYLPDALNELREIVGKKTREGYELLGGASLACGNQRFYVMQTLVKKVNA